jgi:pSer/pThr/pTyr-binding forkhead associated (FHA) protein/chromosome segregation ATPase
MFRTSCGAASPLELKIAGPGWATVEKRVFEQPFVLVGRDESNRLRLEGEMVSRRHAYLQQLGGGVFCIDLGSRTGIRWRGEPRPTGWLRPGQGVEIGPYALELAMAAQVQGGLGDGAAEGWDPLRDQTNDLRLPPRITVSAGNEVLSQLRLNRTMVLVGSSPDCRIRLRDSRVSRHHCSLVRTPVGIWVIDLLSATGTFLNNQPIRWAFVKESSRLRVGPYVLRVEYRDERSETSPSDLSPITISAPARPPEDTSDSGSQLSIPAVPGELPVPARNDLVQPLAAPVVETAPAETSSRVLALQAELDQAREHLQVTETLRQQLAGSQAECDRHRERAVALEAQAAELTVLQARLEAAEATEKELELVRAERSRWQDEAQALKAKIDSHSTEREEWQNQLEAAQQQLTAECEAVRGASARLDQESAALQEVRADLAARNADYSAALKRMQEIQSELALSQDESRGLKTELDQALERQREIEALGQQLADIHAKHEHLSSRVPDLEERANSADRLWDQIRTAGAETEQLRVQLRAAESQATELEIARAECDRLREHVHSLESQSVEAAALQSRLETAEASALDRDGVRAERDQWHAEAQTLQDEIISHSAERQEWQRRLEAAQQELIAEREAGRAMRERLEQESATLQQVRADLAGRNDDYSAALTRLKETQDELEHSQQNMRVLQAELDQDLEDQCNVEALRRQLAEIQVEHAQLYTRVPELEERANSSDQLGDRLRTAYAETEQLRKQLSAVESRIVELETVGTESDRLREQVRSLESQSAEAGSLQSRLEAAEARALELDAIRAERDRWQTEAQAFQARLGANASDQEQIDRLAAELHTAQSERDRLIEHHASLHSAETEQLHEQLRAVESQAAELETVRAECDRLREQVRAFESQVAEVAGMRSRLETAESTALEVDGIRAERDQWQAEARILQVKLASYSTDQGQIDSLTAELHAAQAVRDRLLSEQASLNSANQASARVSELEQQLTEAASSHEKALTEARASWESERQTLEARLEEERQAHPGAAPISESDFQVRIDAAIRAVQNQFATEREEWRQRLQGAESQIVWERDMAKEQSEQLRRQVAALKAERDGLASRLAQTESSPRGAEGRTREEPSHHSAELEQMRQLAARDQLFAELSNVQLGNLFRQVPQAQGHTRPVEPARPRAQLASDLSHIKEQGRPNPIEPATPNPPGRTEGQEAELSPASGENPIEHRSAPSTPRTVQVDVEETSVSTDTPHGSAAPHGEGQSVEELRDWLNQEQVEERRGIWRKVLNFVQGK